MKPPRAAGPSVAAHANSASALGDNETRAKQGAVRVIVRVRPVLAHDHRVGSTTVCVKALTHGRLHLDMAAAAAATAAGPAAPNGHQGGAPTQQAITMSFDLAVDGHAPQSSLFEQSGIKTMLDATLDGYAATVFAYGQTGSGKTFTMTGTDEKLGGRVRIFAMASQHNRRTLLLQCRCALR